MFERASEMRVLGLDLEGAPYDIGFEHGSRFQAEIQEICLTRLAALAAALPGSPSARAQLLEAARRNWDWHERYAGELVRELLGIADGAETEPMELLLLNGLVGLPEAAPSRQILSGGVSFWVGQDASGTQRPYLGQTWDGEPSLSQHVIALRLWPENEQAVLVLSLHGHLGLAGVNEAGVAVVGNQLSATDARDGVCAAFLLRNALAQPSLEDAVRTLVAAPRSSGYNYLVADEAGRAVNVETTAQEVSITLLQKGIYVHTNHYLSRKLGALERPCPAAEKLSSQARLERMRKLLGERQGKLDPPMLQRLMGDHNGEAGSICRHEEPSEVTVAGAVISPQERRMWVALGPPCQEGYRLLSFE